MTIAGSESQTARRSGRAWLALTLVLAAHVADEAVKRTSCPSTTRLSLQLASVWADHKQHGFAVSGRGNGGDKGKAGSRTRRSDSLN